MLLPASRPAKPTACAGKVVGVDLCRDAGITGTGGSGYRTQSDHCGHSVPGAVPETLPTMAYTYSADTASVSVISDNQPDRSLPAFF